MSRKGETKFERRELSQKAVEGITEDCWRTEAHCGNPDIVDLNITEIIVRYDFSTDRDRYGTAAAIVRNTEPEPEASSETEETLPAPKLPDRDDIGRDFVNEPNDLFGEIDNYDEFDLSEYHEPDATGVPRKDDHRGVSPHGETLRFEEDDIVRPLRDPNDVIDSGSFNGH